MTCRPLITACAALLVLGSTATLAVAADPSWTLHLDLRGRRLEGTPVYLTDSHVTLLGRDGYLWDFDPSEAENYGKVSSTFRGYSQSEMRSRLLREFGSKYDVSGTGHYLVVHPAGQRDQWAERFERLYRSFIHYFTARGIRPQPPPFPLVAVVFPTHGDFARYLRRQEPSANPSALGYYLGTSNRVLMYDVTAGKPKSEDWYVNAETIIHEATHQTAFNTGIHNRLLTTPAWVMEGLATMFEAPGVWDAANHPQPAERVNRYQLAQFRVFLSRGRQQWIPGMIFSDQAFQALSGTAYAQSWAVTFYLMEKQPRQYGEYLQKTCGRPVGQEYTPQQRLADFTSVFGDNWPMFEARLARFTDELSE